ncbi:helicase-related protein [Phytoactinopolyspora halotolerans]|uniref:DEAD/DEAH box helicase n=1 Tax=Phytoactinopolyspora halotolerans TaxID=1981512 RepID=A0A6L9S8Y9_9ACTN|nr:helicase-related protein [Phytoactinopolyspora halotolerans]NEE01151.1 DEAD/DEAH box helicase [Phytoactinopolyspora halotolerans]
MTVQKEFPVGSLVRARGREWVVLPDSDDAVLVVRPLGGGDADVAGVLRGIEQIESASFPPPRPDDLGDDRSARLLRDALRIGFRSSGGPFRSLAGLAVEPRPYQLVPLLLALRQETVRLLIADDVGVGKTVEAGLVAAELLAQGSARGLTVVCPPSLAEQWREELSTKFGMQPELVLRGTVSRLERGLEYGQSIFERYPVTVVSTDFIKADRRRDDFLRAAPDLVIVDEAHASVTDDAGRGTRGRTQRYRLLLELADDPARHLILVTATPHSGNEGSFRNLVGLLDPELKTADLRQERARALLATHMVQRRRADIRHYVNADTKFPSDRTTRERAYKLSPQYRALFDDVLAYVRGRVQDRTGTQLEQRVRWWSALSLLRTLASSPAAAAATLEVRASAAGAESIDAADALGAADVLDSADDDALDGADAVPGAIAADDETAESRESRILRAFRKRALAMPVDEDVKLSTLVTTLNGLLKDGFHPVVFCRFIQTAEYVTEHLRQKLRGVTIEVVTGTLAPDDRAARVTQLSEAAHGAPKVLVATDCLSEGINLQRDFQAVVHYDLAWNPTRHEQREGRVDRFGQPAETVRAVTIYGEDTGIDGIVLDVLLRKHEAIRRDLGVSVPVPSQSDQVLSALVEGVLLRGRESEQLALDIEGRGEADQLEEEWRSTAEQEKQSRTRFAQRSIHEAEVMREVQAARQALGSPDDVDAFVRAALHELGADLWTAEYGFRVELAGLPVGLRDALGRTESQIDFYRDLPAPRAASVLFRTDPRVTALARYTLDAALDDALPPENRPARRCGVITSAEIEQPTVALLTRFRIHVTLPGRNVTETHVAEEARVLAFTGPPTAPNWLGQDAVEQLLDSRPTANIPEDVARNMIGHVLDALPDMTPLLNEQAQAIAEELREAHIRVRTAARGERAGALGVRGLEVRPQLPVDILGVYVYRPAGGQR